MQTTDALGRRRHPTQLRGLRSLFPTLPPDCRSRLVRVAMSAAAWRQLDDLLARSAAPTPPRALGELIAQWLVAGAVRRRPLSAAAAAVPFPRAPQGIDQAPSDWQAWQIRKELALLAATAPTVH
jgi:hypothetical protein